jgi:hypothetical protein
MSTKVDFIAKTKKDFTNGENTTSGIGGLSKLKSNTLNIKKSCTTSKKIIKLYGRKFTIFTNASASTKYIPASSKILFVGRLNKVTTEQDSFELLLNGSFDVANAFVNADNVPIMLGDSAGKYIELGLNEEENGYLLPSNTELIEGLFVKSGVDYVPVDIAFNIINDEIFFNRSLDGVLSLETLNQGSLPVTGDFEIIYLRDYTKVAFYVRANQEQYIPDLVRTTYYIKKAVNRAGLGCIFLEEDFVDTLNPSDKYVVFAVPSNMLDPLVMPNDTAFYVCDLAGITAELVIRLEASFIILKNASIPRRSIGHSNAWDVDLRHVNVGDIVSNLDFSLSASVYPNDHLSTMDRDQFIQSYDRIELDMEGETFLLLDINPVRLFNLEGNLCTMCSVQRISSTNAVHPYGCEVKLSIISSVTESTDVTHGIKGSILLSSVWDNIHLCLAGYTFTNYRTLFMANIQGTVLTLSTRFLLNRQEARRLFFIDLGIADDDRSIYPTGSNFHTYASPRFSIPNIDVTLRQATLLGSSSINFNQNTGIKSVVTVAKSGSSNGSLNKIHNNLMIGTERQSNDDVKTNDATAGGTLPSVYRHRLKGVWEDNNLVAFGGTKYYNTFEGNSGVSTLSDLEDNLYLLWRLSCSEFESIDNLGAIISCVMQRPKLLLDVLFKSNETFYARISSKVDNLFTSIEFDTATFFCVPYGTYHMYIVLAYVHNGQSGFYVFELKYTGVIETILNESILDERITLHAKVRNEFDQAVDVYTMGKSIRYKLEVWNNHTVATEETYVEDLIDYQPASDSQFYWGGFVVRIIPANVHNVLVIDRSVPKTNPVEIVRELVQSTHTIDTASFDTASLARADWKCGYVSQDKQTVDKIIDLIGKEHGLLFFENSLGELACKTLDPPSELSSYKSLTDAMIVVENNLVKIPEVFSELDYIITDMSIKYKYDGDKYQGLLEHDQIGCNYLMDTGLSFIPDGNEITLQLETINDDSTAQKIAELKMGFHTTPNRTIDVTTHKAYTEDWEIGDWVQITSDFIVSSRCVYLIIGTSEQPPMIALPYKTLTMWEFDLDALQTGIQEVPDTLDGIDTWEEVPLTDDDIQEETNLL